MHLVTNRHWPYFGPKLGSDDCGQCDLQEWYAKRLLDGWLEEFWEHLETNCAIYFWIFCVNLYLRYQLNCTCFLFLPQLYMYVLVIAYFHCVQFKSSHLLDGLFSYLQGSVMMTDYLYKNVVTLFSVFSMREIEISRDQEMFPAYN